MQSAGNEFDIQGIRVGRNKRPYVLAEIGINHEGDVGLAERLIRAAADAGAHGVKFQTFKAEDLAHPEKAPEYYELFKKMELDRDAHVRLKKVAKECGIAFISTPFGTHEAEMLAEIGVPAIKIASGDVTNYQLLDYVGRLGLPVILSTGMSYLEEVAGARETLIKAGCDKIALLHCVSRYPTLPVELNLRSIETMLREFPEVIGFSDHTEGIWAAPAAVAFGARFIEKHFTLDKALPGPDHALSVEPHELKALIDAENNVYDGLGSGEKTPSPVELEKRHLGRKGFYASTDMESGSVLKPEDIKLSRPQGEIGANEYALVVGRTLKRPIGSGEEITRDHLE